MIVGKTYLASTVSLCLMYTYMFTCIEVKRKYIHIQVYMYSWMRTHAHTQSFCWYYYQIYIRYFKTIYVHKLLNQFINYKIVLLIYKTLSNLSTTCSIRFSIEWSFLIFLLSVEFLDGLSYYKHQLWTQFRHLNDKLKSLCFPSNMIPS